ncbi:MAG: CocE/NonD family hydrolase [SAR202 cluster bacterium]|nr:CocE/NonD family hydrolase [SAR202 cluster bacterium]
MKPPYQGSLQEYDVFEKKDVMIEMRDGIKLACDIYFPSEKNKISNKKFPVLLTRTPYNKSRDFVDGRFFARRGYIYIAQDVRGRFNSEGIWYAFAKEAPDGYDTIEWIAKQEWSNGKIGTLGSSYAGSDQSALATLNPPHLSTMIVAVGASNYYDSSMRQNGALEQRFIVYAFSMAISSKEAASNPTLKNALIKVFTQDIESLVDNFPIKKNATILRELPSYEQWAIDISTNSEYNDYWKQRGYAISEYYQEHADIPSLYLGGWYDSYARNTCESYLELSKIKSSPQVLLMGPWTHGGWQNSFSGEVDFGNDSVINYNDTRLSWFDCYLKEMETEFSNCKPVKIFTMGGGNSDRLILGSPRLQTDYPGMLSHGGYWKESSSWPLPETKFTKYFIHYNGTLSTKLPNNNEQGFTQYDFDPNNPVPTIGGGISAADAIMVAGAFDQRGRPNFHGCENQLPLNTRHDILSFETKTLIEPIEITGPIKMHLFAASSAIDTDFTCKLLDIYPSDSEYPEGLAINITDSIIRARYRNHLGKSEFLNPEEIYEFIFELYPTSNIFNSGHKIRIDISSSNWPRFDVNPNTGQNLGSKNTYKTARQTIYHSTKNASYISLPIINN